MRVLIWRGQVPVIAGVVPEGDSHADALVPRRQDEQTEGVDGRWRRRAYGWRNEEAIGATICIGKPRDPSLQRALREIAQTAGRRHQRSIRTTLAALAGTLPVVVAILVGLVAGNAAGWITAGIAYAFLLTSRLFSWQQLSTH